MSTKKNTTVYKKQKTSKYGGKKSRKTTRKNRKIRKTTRTKKGGTILNPEDEIGTRMTAGELLNDSQQYIGRILRCSQAQEAGRISRITPHSGDMVRVYFHPETSPQKTTEIDIPNNWIIYLEEQEET